MFVKQYIVITVIIFLVSLWNLMIAILGLFPQCLSTAVGTLTKSNTKKNVRSKHGYIIPVMTRYAYTYAVNGKKYKYTATMYHSKRRLLPKASMEYVKWFPNRAYPNKFKGTTEWVLGIIMLLAGISLIFAIISM